MLFVHFLHVTLRSFFWGGLKDSGRVRRTGRSKCVMPLLGGEATCYPLLPTGTSGVSKRFFSKDDLSPDTTVEHSCHCFRHFPSWRRGKEEQSPRNKTNEKKERVTRFATSNKCIASSNKCLTSSNKKLLGAPGLTRKDRTLLETPRPFCAVAVNSAPIKHARCLSRLSSLVS